MFSNISQSLEIQDRPITEEQRTRIERLCELWVQYAPAVNLTARVDPSSLREQLSESLLLASLALDVGVCAEQRWIDVGSGGGFPGLVIAATLDVGVTLVEPRQRRAAFLQIALAALDRDDCTVARARLETSGWKALDRGWSGPTTQWASSRATFSPEEWLARSRQIVEPGGFVFAHLHAGQKDPSGWTSRARREQGRWSVRAFRVD